MITIMLPPHPREMQPTKSTSKEMFEEEIYESRTAARAK